MNGLGSMAGLVVKVDRAGVCAAVDNDEGALFTVGRAYDHRDLGAVAWIVALADDRMAWIDRHGTEVRSRYGADIDPTPGEWAWLLDLAVEAGLVLDIDTGPG